MDPLLVWPPIIWLSRLLAFLLLSGVTVIVILLLIRLARRKTWSAIVSGELPRLKTMRLLGQEFDIGTKMDGIRDEQLVALERRLDSLEALIDTEARNAGADAWNERRKARAAPRGHAARTRAVRAGRAGEDTATRAIGAATSGATRADRRVMMRYHDRG